MSEETKTAIRFTFIVGLGVAFMISLAWQAGKTQESTKIIRVTATFEDLLDAIEWIESKGEPNAVGDNGNAVGSFQIWKVYVDDANRIFKLYIRPMYRKDTFSYEDRWSRDKSREMVKIYLWHYGKDKSFEDMARIHNGGPNGYKKDCTKAYWAKVKARLEL